MRASSPAPPGRLDDRHWLRSLAVLGGCFLLFALLIPPPEGISPQGWRMAGIFVTVIVGMILEPLPPAAVVLLGLVAVVANGAPMRDALGGFSEPSVWMVVATMITARVMITTGLARRIALLFVRQVGSSSLGVSYAFLLSDVTLATGVPSITARTAGMLLPIARSVSDLFGSSPGPTAHRLGGFLIPAMYQGSAIACAMFLTGQASNILGAGFARALVGYEITWAGWFVAAVVPGAASCLAVPYVVYRLTSPEVRRTPEAATFAREGLTEMGPLRRPEWVALVVFVGMGGLWASSAWHGLDVAFVALLGLSVLLVTGTMAWADVISERPAWDVFIWYGGLLRMGQLLNETGVTERFAVSIGGLFVGLPWIVTLVGVLLVYFYSHYFFASITAHVVAMFPPFVVLLTSVGVPTPLAVYSLLCLANLPAGLTHYGTTPAPILYSLGFVSLRTWWHVGLVVSVVNLAIWLTIGFAWWKLLGFW
jgi:divalent anion:Na+ symporter, DASS family